MAKKSVRSQAMLVSARFGGLERKFMETTLEGSPAALGWCKLQRKRAIR